MNTVAPATGNPLDGALPPYAGHGTFIAGLIRQQCPQARILAVPIMAGDGVVGEGLLMRTLVALLIRHAVATEAGNRDTMIDVLCLSLGYYHEEPADAAIDPMLRGLLTAVGSWGVAVVTAAGNNATVAPFHPAAFAAQVSGFDAQVVPLVSVGALNPNGTAVAYFSNAGPWVSCHRLGANLISTLPTDLNGDSQPSARMMYHQVERATIDPDDFSGGFGTWSGTSFAAPVLAGQLARQLALDPAPSSVGRIQAVARGWSAVAHELPGWAP